jgi:magnesium chelatase family protein
MFKINTFKLNGMEAVPVTVECDITPGIGIHLVGLADLAVKESLLRTVTALDALGFRIPGKRIIINLAPADLRKSDCRYDLPIALAIIGASGQADLKAADEYIVAGELGLDGSIREVSGWVQAALLAGETMKSALLPKNAALLAADAVEGNVQVYSAGHLREAVEILSGARPEFTAYDLCSEIYSENQGSDESYWDAIGHAGEKRALEIAAAGGHPVLMVGGPGRDKAMLAKALREILPVMTRSEALEVLKVYSTAGHPIEPGRRPFREVCQATAMVSLLGGGAGECVLPGAVSLASNGVLLFDEFLLAPKWVTAAMASVLEGKEVTLTRLKSVVKYPANFFPVFAMQPCPCGLYGDGDLCRCSPEDRLKYFSKVPGEIYERLTLHMIVHGEQESSGKVADPAEIVAERVFKARERQMARQGCLNNELKSGMICDHTYLGEVAFDALNRAMSTIGLSPRAYSNIIRIARTIADIEGAESIGPLHIYEAASYRFLDRGL